MAVDLVAGRDYPRSYSEVRSWFGQDWRCLDYLDWLRWPTGLSCPGCGSERGWRLADARWKCAGCQRKVSATAGTIFDRTRTPLTVWLAVAWRMVADKAGVSATQVQREMRLGSYQTAWAMLHRYRQVMVLPGRDRLQGQVEVDEAFLGGPQPGKPGRGALGKTLLAGAVERTPAGKPGRARLGLIDAASAECLRQFLWDNVEPGATVVSDGWRAYPRATKDLYEHVAINISAGKETAHEQLPAVHLVFSLVKRWIDGTLQGSASPEHLQAYLDEWIFRFNRRRSASRGLLFYRLLNQAIQGPVITYRDLRKAHYLRPAPPHPASNQTSPPSLELPDPGLPWRRLTSNNPNEGY